MKVNWKMPQGLRPYFLIELRQYKEYSGQTNLSKAWRHLERAHILGQPWAVEHTKMHWIMLGFGFKIKDWHEIAGQIPRLLVGGVKSFVGKIPVGNTGGADVPPLKAMEIPEDLQLLINQYKSEK